MKTIFRLCFLFWFFKQSTCNKLPFRFNLKDGFKINEEVEIDVEEPVEIVVKSNPLVSGLVLAAKGAIGLGAIGAAYVGIRYLHRRFMSAKLAFESGPTSATPIAELVSSVFSKNSEGVVSESSLNDTNKFVCLVFDCDNEITSAEDLKARTDYFLLMQNLTSKVSNMNTLYIPGSGNEHMIEKNKDFNPNWQFFLSSGDSGRKTEALRKKYSVRPEELRIVMIAPDGKVISENAIDQLRINPRAMPWQPLPIYDIIGDELLAPSGGNMTTISLKGKKTVLYFSAAWCKPCQTFLPKLIDAYKLLNPASTTTTYDSTSTATSTDVEGNATASTVEAQDTESPPPSPPHESEVDTTATNTNFIFVSLDRELKAFDEYRSQMPWLALPFRDIRRAELQNGLRIRAIPAVVVLDEEGKILTTSGVTDLFSDPELASFPWLKDVTDVGSGANVEKLERGPVLIALIENCNEEVQEVVTKAMKKISQDALVPVLLPRSSREDLSFGILSAPGKLSDAMRSLCLLPSVDVERQLNSKLINSDGTTSSSAKPIFIIIDLLQAQFAVGSPLTELDTTSNSEILFNSVYESIKLLNTKYKSYEIEMSEMERAAAGQREEAAAGEEDVESNV